MQVYTVDEVRKLIEVASPQWRKDVIEFAFRTGMRTNEIFALKWDAVDLKNKRIIIQASCSYSPEYGVVESPPKTASSIRCIDIDTRCVDILQHTPHISKYVFARDNGEPRHGTTVQMFRLCDKAGIARRGLRHMRTTHISLLVSEGISLPEIQCRVGHRSPDTLLRYYTQFAVGRQNKSVTVLNKIDLR